MISNLTGSNLSNSASFFIIILPIIAYFSSPKYEVNFMLHCYWSDLAATC